jgi:hypothetical protein
MSTRSIVTSQPDVACDVCTRRLLRGEQPDVFVVAGERRLVCELCAPRAAHEGWTRETEAQPLTLAPARPRRGRGLFDRLRGGAVRSTLGQTRDSEALVDAQPGELFDAFASEAEQGRQHQPAGAEQPPVAFAAATAEPSSYAEHALMVFNDSEFPRRVAGVARSLGPPAVTVRSAEHLDSVVSIVVAWELCWYRYEVDLSEPGAEAQAIAQGTELSELAREDRLANAAASEAGTLALA